MVSIGLSAGSVGRIRFGLSSLWEVASSVRVLRDPGDHALHWLWAKQVRKPLVDAGLIGPNGGLLWQLIPASPDYSPDFLTPSPVGLDAGLDAELAALVDTSHDVVRADLRLYAPHPAGLIAELRDDPDAGLRRLAIEIRAYWEIAIEAHWPAITKLLQGEVMHRARRLASGGASALLNDLHQRVSWDDQVLSIAGRACQAPSIVDGGGLILVPSVFVWPCIATVSATEPVQLAYPPRGVATLWERSPETIDAVVNLIGRGRARLLLAMTEPASTTELARRTGMSAGGVSQHLAVLRAAGLAVSYRHGKAVFNAQTPMAVALLAAAA